MPSEGISDIVAIEAKTYSVFIGDLWKLSLRDFVRAHYDLSDMYVLVDEHTEAMCFPILAGSFGNQEEFSQIKKISIPAGEHHKTLDTVASIAKSLSTSNASRKALLINLGGGVLCDIGGFAASIYKRGIDFINIPTTLLSQVDASIGGKVGVDLDGLKNYLGVFKNPRAVYVSPGFIATLEHREVVAGFAEVIKHGLIADREYFELIQSHNLEYTTETSESWSQLIARSIEIKNKIVTEDPTEQGIRKVLNFGHTVGHAVETYYLNSDKPLLHGEAIAIGMICELYLSSILADLDHGDRDQICDFIKRKFTIESLETIASDQLLDIMRADKKNSGKNINFTLLNEVGSPNIDQVASENMIIDALNFYNDLF